MKIWKWSSSALISTWGETCLTAILRNANPKWIALGSNSGLQDQKPTCSHFSSGNYKWRVGTSCGLFVNCTMIFIKVDWVRLCDNDRISHNSVNIWTVRNLWSPQLTSNHWVLQLPICILLLEAESRAIFWVKLIEPVTMPANGLIFFYKDGLVNVSLVVPYHYVTFNLWKQKYDNY